MKKYIRSVCLVLALISLFGLTACGGKSQEKPEEAVKQAIEAMRALDKEKMKESVALDDKENVLDETLSGMTEENKKFAEAMMTRLNYKIKESKTNGDNATVTLDITNLDMNDLMTKFMSEAMAYAFEHPNENQESTDKYMAELFVKLAASPEAKVVTTTDVAIKLVKKDGKWKIVPDEKLTSAMLGGFKGLQN